MKDSKLSTTKEEKDLGVLITDNLKPSSQCTAAVNKTMSALRWSKRSFHYLDIESFRILYKTYIRPNLEFVIQAWSPYLDKDIKIMEKIQRQATKMVPALFNLQYEDRLKKLGIYSLAARRLRGDLIETFKLLHGHTNIDYEIFFKLNNTTETRGHNWKLFKPQTTKGLQCRVIYGTNFLVMWYQQTQQINLNLN